MPSASGGSGLMSWKACEPAWRRGWRCTISVSGSTSNLVVLGWLSLICWSGDLNSHQAFKRQPQELRPLDEPEPGDLFRTVEAVSALSAWRLLQQPTPFVVANRLDGQSRLAGKLSDLQPTI